MATLIGYAQRARMTEARQAFRDGATVLVHDSDRGSEVAVWSSSTVHNRNTTSWETLHAEVKMWRGRYPRQTFYVIGAAR